MSSWSATPSACLGPAPGLRRRPGRSRRRRCATCQAGSTWASRSEKAAVLRPVRLRNASGLRDSRSWWLMRSCYPLDALLCSDSSEYTSLLEEEVVEGEREERHGQRRYAADDRGRDVRAERRPPARRLVLLLLLLVLPGLHAGEVIL